MIELLFVAIAIFGAIIASVTDIRHGIIPNKLSFSLIGIGILGSLIYSTYGNNFDMFLQVIKSVVIIFIVGYIFWMVGGWSAGDVKEFMFLAALIPQYPAIFKKFFAPSIASYPFVITILINTFLAILPFVMIYSILVSYSKLSLSKFLEPIKGIDKYAKSSFVVVACASFIALLGIHKFFLVTFLLALFMIKESYRFSISGAFIISYLIFLGGINILTKTVFLIKYFFIVLAFFLGFKLFWNSLSILRKEALHEETKISELQEGTIIAEEIYKKNNKIVREDRSVVGKIKEAIKTKKLNILLEKKDMIVNARAAGVTIEEIKTLKRYVKEGKLEDKIRIKKRMPFAPVIFAGLIISLVFGDLVTIISRWF